MERKTFFKHDIDRDEIWKMKDDYYRHVHPHRMHLDNEVKLFTDKNLMVDYVNKLTGIENVEIFKIEDNLYKVLISRRKILPQKEENK